jgi:hypothetical protein
MEFLEEYRYPTNYHSGKANVVADALSHKVRIARLRIQEVQPVKDMQEQEVEVQGEKIRVSNLKATPDQRQEIIAAQAKDNGFQT